MEKGSKVIAKVEGKEITERNVVDFIKSMDPNIAQNFQSEEGIRSVIDEMVNQELLYLDAVEKKYDEEEEFKEALESMKENLLKSYAFSKVVSDKEVSEQDAKDYYESVKEAFNVPESVNASHILVDTEEEANDISEKLENGGNFEELAKEYSTCPSKEQGGNLGQFYPGQMVPEFDEKVFSMEENEISEPVKTQFGYHIIKLNSKSPAETKSYEDVKDQCKVDAGRIKQQKDYLNAIEKLKEKYTVELY